MEIKATLQKPYEENDRLDFIIQYNHTLGYIIEETETELQALGYTKEELEQQEKERIGNLTCTKRVFALMLQELGVDYITVLLPLIESNSQAKLEWDLSVQLLRSNPFIDKFGLQLGLSSYQIDLLFKVANGEATVDELKATLQIENIEKNITED